MKPRKAIVTASVAVSACVLIATHGYAQGVGNLASLPVVFPADPSNTGWFIGQYGVSLDPNGPPWIKSLVNPNGGPMIVQPGQTFTLQESLFIAPSLPWKDWHEQILTPDWDWASPVAFLANGVPAPNLTISHTPPTGTSGGTLDFNFDPLPVGTKIDIRKQLKYIGSTGKPFDGVVRIAEYPTPEPATLGLLGLGGAVMLRRRHRTNAV